MEKQHDGFSYLAKQNKKYGGGRTGETDDDTITFFLRDDSTTPHTNGPISSIGDIFLRGEMMDA